MRKILIIISFITLLLCFQSCTLPDSTMPRTYVYFDSYEEITNHIIGGNMKPLRPELTEEEYEEKCASGELEDYGFHYRNYILTDLLGSDDKITDGCYLINISGDNKASPYEIKGTIPLIFIYKIENGEGLDRIVLMIKSIGQSQIDLMNEQQWELENRYSIDYYDYSREWRIAKGFEPKEFVKYVPPSSPTYNITNKYVLGNIVIYFLYNNENVTTDNITFEEKIKYYIQENLTILAIE